VITLLAIRTFYPQWAVRSGINQYLKYLDKDDFNIVENLVPMGDELFPLQAKWIKDLILKIIRRSNHTYNLNDLMAELSSYRTAHCKDIDIIQYFDSEHTLYLLPSFVRKVPPRKRPIIIGMFHQPKSVLDELVSPKVVKHLDHIILMSSEQKSFFSAVFPDNKISVILHGIDTDYYKPDYQRKDKEKFKCITVGRWMRDYETLSKVAERLRDRRHIEFHVVSDIMFDADHSNIVVHRDISDEELLGLYQQVDLLFMPLKDATANNSVLEGLACGLPVLTSELQSTSEYLADTDALFVKNNHVETFKKHILDLASNREKCIQWGQSSRKRALVLSWPNVAEQYGKLYSTLIKERG
jgi:glycosyltransferase involved in cell wall biosynthesis